MDFYYEVQLYDKDRKVIKTEKGCVIKCKDGIDAVEKIQRFYNGLKLTVEDKSHDVRFALIGSIQLMKTDRIIGTN